jgi:GT2 family glycosyltransferase
VVLTYNIKDMALDCIESVQQAAQGIRVEIIVSDNGSSDGTQEEILKRFPEVVLVDNRNNLGYAAGNNRGVEVSRGRQVLILNPDTLVDEDTLRLCMEYMDNHPKCGVMGCRVLNRDGSVQPSWFPKWSLFHAFWAGLGLNYLFPYNRIDGKLRFFPKEPQSPVVVDRVLGCFFWIRREVLDRIGMFDEEFFLYGEEEDYCQRVRDVGMETHYFPGVNIVHFGGQSTRKIAIQARVEANASKARFMKKHRGWLGSLAFRVVWSTALVLRLIVRIPLLVVSRFHGNASGFTGMRGWRNCGRCFGYGGFRLARAEPPKGQVAESVEKKNTDIVKAPENRFSGAFLFGIMCVYTYWSVARTM